MFESVGRSVVLLGGAAGLTFCLGAGVAVGLVPQAGGGSGSSTETVAAAQDVSAPASPDTTAAPAPETPEAATSASPDTTAPATQTARVAESAAVATYEEEPAAEGVVEAPAPPAPTTAPRLNPSSAQIQSAIAQIRARIPLYSPTEAQAREFGNQVCSAFDAGQSGAQVKAQALQATSQVPFVTVSASDVDFAVRTAVQLFCPGYSSQL